MKKYRLVFKDHFGDVVKRQIVSMDSYDDARRHAQNLMCSGVLGDSIIGILVEICF